MTSFADRRDAGRRLADAVAPRGYEDPVVLGLPRGGVVVAAEVAARLGAPLDVLVVRKLRARQQPELALGAVTDGTHPQRVLNDDLIRATGTTDEYLEREVETRLAEVRQCQERYRRGRPAVDVAGRTAIVVDDGIATGATVRAGLAALRARAPARLVLAVPVAPPQTVKLLRAEVDDLVCLDAPWMFAAVGAFYADFSQTTDDEVEALLAGGVSATPRSDG
ncbi:MAG: phosphoribosyltransferase [Planctomycetota bacterium]|jgi:putative phosphoribosyl transferase